jgi:hypothetical protein
MKNRPVVEAAPLVDFIQVSVDMMKIDAEGSEPLVFEGMPGTLNRSPHLTIFMEFSIPIIRQSSNPRNFLNGIRELGFSCNASLPGTLSNSLTRKRPRSSTVLIFCSSGSREGQGRGPLPWENQV